MFELFRRRYAIALGATLLAGCGQVSQTLPVTTTNTSPPIATTTSTVVEVGISAVSQQSGLSTKAAQQKLIDLGFWLLNVDGNYDNTTRQAVMAFQKYYRLRPTGSINTATAWLLDRQKIRPRGQSTSGSQAEVDKSRQLVFLVHDGQTVFILNASTGDDRKYTEPDGNTPGVMISGTAITPEGKFRINRERPEGWWIGDLGQIYRPKYFSGGIAIHGSYSVPAYPSSHGCVRVSTAAMDMIWDLDLLPRSTRVWVYA
ncbi:MAG: L,D-transpeptidase family protein [Ilumatobacteraceae bacterium]